MRSISFRAALVLTVVFGLWSGAAEAQQAARPPACTSAEHHQFDFWIGDWEVTLPNGKFAGTNRIDPILTGCVLRDCWFEPTFHKHVGKLCSGVHIHAEGPAYAHAAFRPWRIQALAFKAIRSFWPHYDLWRDFPYEYELGKLPIDVINGSALLREWVDDSAAVPDDLDDLTAPDEDAWEEERRPFLLY